jgi:fumarate hydratase subunit alpha
MREVDVSVIKEKIANLCMETNYRLPESVLTLIKEGKNKEISETGCKVLEEIIENNEIAKTEHLPLCQDTGFAVVFLEIGQEVYFVGGNLYQAINEGVKEGYEKGYLRKCIVTDPVFLRKNTKDNTPAIIYTEITEGDKVKITFCPKGGGAENMSEVKMLTPAQGIEGIKEFVIERVEKSNGNPCPPIVVGVGIGGTFEKCAFLAKKALLREPVGGKNKDEKFAQVEEELLEEINKLGIGPMGLGGRVTALAVHIETYPCHIATMPVAVNLNCHVVRHKTIII